MKSEDLVSIITSLGKSHSELIAMGIVPNVLPSELFPGSETIYFELQDGVSMSFSPEGLVFIKLFLTLRKSVPSAVEYSGELPGRLVMEMNQEWVRNVFGTPKSTHGPVKLPQPIGLTGGWDIYPFDTSLLPGVDLVFKYTGDGWVKHLVFELAA